MAWVERENESAAGRSIVAHDPIPYREALASLRTGPTNGTAPMCATCDVVQTAASVPLHAVPVNSMQQRWADGVAAARAANTQNLPKHGK